jgi:hypothetical protein
MWRVDVTAEDIATGWPRHCRKCAVAIAAKRATGLPVVDVFTTEIHAGGRRYRLPPVVTDFIIARDRGDDCQPISFLLGDGS